MKRLGSMQRIELKECDRECMLYNGRGFKRLVDKWMGILGTSTMSHFIRFGRVVEERWILNFEI